MLALYSDTRRLWAGHLASFTITMEICDWNSCQILNLIWLSVWERLLQTWTGGGGEQPQVLVIWQLACQTPCRTTHLPDMQPLREGPSLDPDIKRGDTLSKFIRTGFQKRNSKRTAEILVICIMSKQTSYPLWFCKEPCNAQDTVTEIKLVSIWPTSK